jgi:hypothetical protein
VVCFAVALWVPDCLVEVWAVETVPELAVSLLEAVFEAEATDALGTDDLLELATDPSTEAEAEWVADPEANEAVGAEAVSLL